MVGLTLDGFRARGRPPTLLCVGAHCDDIEIGCGGTILTLLSDCPGTSVHWVVLSSDDARRAEAVVSADRFLAAAGAKAIRIMDFRDGFLPYEGREIKECFQSLRSQVDPDLVFTHQGLDAHQDHRLVHELTWNAFRDHLVLEYEIPKYDGDLGRPNLFVPLDRQTCARKLDLLRAAFPSQRSKPWYCDETFLAVLRLRGNECRAAGGHAEAFYCRKLVLSVGRKECDDGKSAAGMPRVREPGAEAGPGPRGPAPGRRPAEEGAARRGRRGTGVPAPAPAVPALHAPPDALHHPR